MFQPGSRYEKLGVNEIEIAGPEGARRIVRYVQRRIIPPPEAWATLLEYRIAEGDRLDRMTARFLGDPLQFWRVADANGALWPEALVTEIGRVIRIALPQS